MKKLTTVLCMTVALTATGCASKATTGTDTAMAGQSRTLPERMTDFGIQRNIINGLVNVNGVGKDNVRVAATSFRGDVLLTGEVPNEQMKTEIGNMALSIREVKDLYNYLQITDVPKSQSHTNHEKYLQSKIRAKLINSSLNISQYKVIVRSDTAYVLGEMTKEQQDEIIEAVRSTDGIQGVVLANKILSMSDVANSYNGTSTNNINNNAAASNAGYDDTAVYPNATNANQYNTNTGYPNSLYTNNGQPAYNPPTYNQPNRNQPTAQPAYTPTNSNATSGYVQLYQGTNKP